jgi:phosphoribosyl 1,2-cyclic phosphodiesterase
VPELVLDAGTGLLRLADTLGARAFRGTILLTHLHWDHVQGLPFFGPGDREAAEVALLQPAQGDPEALLERAMSPPHFPIRPAELRGSWRHEAIDPGWQRIAGFDVLAREVRHKGGRTFGYRIVSGGAVCCYVPDAADDEPAVDELADGADLFIRGAPFIGPEVAWARAFGHGTMEVAQAVAERAAARRLVITHHAPRRGDGELAAIRAELGVEFATEDLIVDLDPRNGSG